MPTPKKQPARPLSSYKTGKIRIPSGTEIYDGIMSRIEPELLSTNLKTLDVPYKKETKDEHATRYKRYSKAFAEYKKRYSMWAQNFKRAIKAYKRAVTKAVERLTKGKEDLALLALEEQMKTA